MSKFITVQAYVNGVGQPEQAMVINIDSIISFRQGSYRVDKETSAPCVWLDTVRAYNMAIAGTVADLLAKINQCRDQNAPSGSRPMRINPFAVGSIVHGKRVVEACWEYDPDIGDRPCFRLEGESEYRYHF